MTTVAETLAHILNEYGIETVFGLPGGENLAVLAALRQRGIRFVLVRNESSAVYMADVTARLTGRPGVCLTTLGPGATNALAGVAHAYLDRAPVLVLTAESPEADLGRHTHQVLDLQAVFQPMTKQTSRLTPAGAADHIRQALNLTMAGRPGPVHLSLIGADADTAVSDSATETPASPSTPTDANALAAAQAQVAQARRPIIVTGLGVEPQRPYPQLQALAEQLNAPVIDTPKSKGALANDHPLFAGTIGLMKSDPAYAMLDEADCIIAVGFDVVELVRIWDYTKPLIWVAPWPNIDPAIPATVALVGEIGPTLRSLASVENQTDAAWGKKRVRLFRDGLATRSLPVAAEGRLLPQQVLETVRRCTPRDTLITTDVGSHKILTALTWPAYAPNRFMLSNGLSAMGFGLPAAIAAALELQQPVVCITGDAGFGMVLGELSLLTEYDLPVIIIVMNDAALDLIRAKQLRRADDIYGTEFVNPHFADIAAAFEIPYRQVSDASTCAEAVRTAVVEARPMLIEALIDPISYPTTPGQGGQP
ncbi:MAG: thiamine pyrophosphate-binding protein [Anaerolineae bacterium]|nr:thiamine pyrophosphate-binding protein [Anaerolineae bacterium]